MRQYKAGNMQDGTPLKVFFPLDVIAAPGRRTFVLFGDMVVDLPSDHRYVRRRVLKGDLIMVRSSQGPQPIVDKPKPRKPKGKSK